MLSIDFANLKRIIFLLQRKIEKEEKEDEADKGKKENDEGRRTTGRTRSSLGLIGFIIQN